MTSDKCSCCEFCVAAQLQLKEYQIIINCENSLHYACKIGHEINHGYEGKIKLRYNQCAGCDLINVNMSASDTSSVKNKQQPMIEISTLDATCDEASQTHDT